MQCEVCSILYTVFRVQSVVCTVLYVLCSVSCVVCCVLCPVSCVVCSVSCVLCTVYCVVCPAQCAVCSVQCLVCSVQCVVCSVQCVVCSVQCVVCRVQCGLAPPPSYPQCRELWPGIWSTHGSWQRQRGGSLLSALSSLLSDLYFLLSAHFQIKKVLKTCDIPNRSISVGFHRNLNFFLFPVAQTYRTIFLKLEYEAMVRQTGLPRWLYGLLYYLAFINGHFYKYY